MKRDGYTVKSTYKGPTLNSQNANGSLQPSETLFPEDPTLSLASMDMALLLCTHTHKMKIKMLLNMNLIFFSYWPLVFILSGGFCLRERRHTCGLWVVERMEYLGIVKERNK